MIYIVFEGTSKALKTRAAVSGAKEKPLMFMEAPETLKPGDVHRTATGWKLRVLEVLEIEAEFDADRAAFVEVITEGQTEPVFN